MPLFAVIVFICFYLPAVAASSEAPAKTVRGVFVETAPIMDGKLDDDVWSKAAVVDDLHMVNPNEYEVPQDSSRFYILYTRDALYVGGQFRDREPDKISVFTLRQGDFSWGEAGMSVILDPFHKGRSGYMFDMNPNAIRNQALFTNVTEQNWQWNGIWHGAAQLTADGWTGEMEIPFKTLSFDPSNDTWGINFSRWIGRRNEQYGWVSHNRDQNPASSGKMTGIRGIEQGVGLDVVPALRMSTYKDFNPSLTNSNFEPSLNIFYKLTPALTGALTFNTDFSGTDADSRQVNLTRFGLFYPERRDFFLQDSDIFDFGGIGGQNRDTTLSRVERENGRPFFSRRMGLGMDGAVVDINAGAKLTGRIGRWNIGLLDISQNYAGNAGTSNLLVGRIAANVLEESSLGAIITSGDPTSEVDNTLLGVDFRYVNTRLASGKTILGSAWYQQSDSNGIEGDDAAFGFRLSSPNSGGWRGSVGAKELQENFYPALGFAHRVDIRDYSTEAAYTFRPENSFVRSIYSGIEAERIERISGELETQIVTWRLAEFENHSRDMLKLHYQNMREVLTEPFEISEGIVIPVGDYSFNQVCANVEAGGQRAVSGQLYACDGDFFTGQQQSTGTSLLWRPSLHFKFELGFDFNNIELPQGDFMTRLASVRADIAFNRAWSWQNHVQYDNVSNSIGLNSIVRWLPRAGREMVFVLNREFEDTDLTSRFRSTSQDLAFKLSYTFRF